MDLLTNYENRLLVRNLSKHTIEVYVSVAKKLLAINANFFSQSQEEIINFLAAKVKRGCSGSAIAQHIAVIDGIRKDIVGIPDNIKIKKPQRDAVLPDVLTTEEFQKLYSTIRNTKHKIAVALMYSTGMRVGEVVSLKIKDIDSLNNKIIIRKPKGKVDRVVLLDEKIFLLIKEYLSEYNPKEYFLNGEKGGQYSSRSIQMIVKSACKKANIEKNISTHSMRHSCFTQLIKNGTDLRTVQRLAGHKNINTTAGYIRITDQDVLDIKSPIKSIIL